MPILYIRQGNIFNTETQTIVNTVNCYGVMGAGLALQVKERYPECLQSYEYLCYKHLFKPGNTQLVRVSSERWILNFATKDHWTHPSKIEWIERGLYEFVAKYKQRGITSAAFSPLGCGNGKLSWARVQPLMEQYLTPLPITVEIYAQQ